MSRITPEFRWRNFSAFAPDLVIKTKKNLPVEIDLSPYWVQGVTTPIKTEDIEKRGFQGGWLHNFIAMGEPTFGLLQPSYSAKGWKYYPGYDFIGVDCFNYVLNNGTQHSNIAKIQVVVQDWYSGTIQVRRKAGTNEFSYEGKVIIPAGLPKPTLISYRWYDIIPTVLYEGGRPFVYELPKFFFGTQYRVVEAGSCGWELEVYDKGNITPWRVMNQTRVEGYLPGTSIPYIQGSGPYPVRLVVHFYTDVIAGCKWNGQTGPNSAYIFMFDGWKSVELMFELDIRLVRGHKRYVPGIGITRDDWWYNDEVLIIDPNATPSSP
jgi:hypothetical protein